MRVYDANSSPENDALDGSDSRPQTHKKIQIKQIGGVVLRNSSSMIDENSVQSVESCEFEEGDDIKHVSIHNSGYSAVNYNQRSMNMPLKKTNEFNPGLGPNHMKRK